MPELTDNPSDIRAGIRLAIYNVASVATEAGASRAPFLTPARLIRGQSLSPRAAAPHGNHACSQEQRNPVHGCWRSLSVSGCNGNAARCPKTRNAETRRA